MATAPTLVNTGASVFNTTTTPKTIASVALTAGQKLVVCGVSADSTGVVSTPTGVTGASWSSTVVSVSNRCYVGIWQTDVINTETITLSVARTGGTIMYGFRYYIWSGSDGFGAVLTANAANSTPSVSPVTQADNSAYVSVNGDWDAEDGTTRTARTNAGSFTENTYFRDASNYTVYIGHHPDAGTATTDAIGWTAPTGQTYAIAALEIKGSSSGTQTVVMQLITAASTLFNPTVVPGSVTIVTPLISASSTLFSPGVIHVVVLPTISVPSTVFNPTVVPGTATVVTPLIEAPSTVFQPVVSSGGVIVAPVINAVSTVFNPTVINMLQIVVAQLISVPSTIFNPTVTGGGAPTVAGSVADQARVNMLVEVGVTLDSNADLMRKLILDGDQTLITVTSASATIQLMRYMMDLRD